MVNATTTTVLPGLVGRPRVFGREDVTPLGALTSWAAALELRNHPVVTAEFAP
jgi:hypothetical protein